MFGSDNRSLDRPELPQYGRELAMCQARLPSGAALWIRVAMTGFCFLTIAAFASIMLGQLPHDQTVRAGVIFAAFALTVGAWVASGRSVSGVRKESVFIFERGLHLCERVTYHVPGGQWIEIRRAVRHVSLPWRVLSQLKVLEGPTHGMKDTVATVRIPDGRTLKFSTSDGPEVAVALSVLSQNVR